MYFNVYSMPPELFDHVLCFADNRLPVIICIFIGAFLGAYIFHWENLSNG